ncbi:hypothetical protein VD0004_g3113 [Verticillium dahliae]|uniref:Mid2 domain-containing protein n=1 Tax=Verticillium dahliae TaxID=27337 RepID=A0A444RVW0_VERDA|nr:hypothetical protein VD0004_g3113 [Verticillium dahliae]PNH76936.1 hypothetical protein VD0001_g659 [Verticillium dahliae]RXG45301.1 hypothetical protein VDGE_06720 [Verticillium dahliae]
MGLISVARPLLLVFLLFLAGTAWAQNDDGDDSSSQAKNITCYGVGGKSYGDNYKCPGSNACCGSVDLCLPNRLCKSVGMSDDIFIRGPCSINPYDEEECAQICLYSENTGNGRFPQVTICTDGSYCCNNDPQCCARGRGTFLDARGKVIDNPTASSSSSASSSATRGASTSSATAAAASTTASEPPTSETPADPGSGNGSSSGSGSGDGLGLKVGLGLGIPLAAIVVALGVWFLVRRRKRAVEPVEVSEAGQYYAKGSSPPQSTFVDSQTPTPRASPLSAQYQVSEMDAKPKQVHELEGTSTRDRGTAELH